MSYVIGVDPGLSGGLAAIGEDGLELEVMPTVAAGRRREIDEQAVVAWLLEHRPRCVFIERVQAMPKQGVVSMFTFGVGWGLIRGICAGMGIPYELVQPPTRRGSRRGGGCSTSPWARPWRSMRASETGRR